MAGAAAPAQNPEQLPSVIRTGVREVVLDVIVRHKDMSLDRKLRAGDFTIAEDGVPQTVKGFRFVTGREASVMPNVSGSGPNRENADSPKLLQEPSFVSVVFGEMGMEGRRNAIQAATAFLDKAVQGDTYAAVFGMNLRVSTRSDFTTDRQALARSLRQAANATGGNFATPIPGVLNQTTYSTASGPDGVSIDAGGDLTQRPDFATSGASQAPLSEGQRSIAAAAEAQRPMVSSIAGMAVMNTLLRLIENEAKLPGRKTVLYLSEGLIKPPNRPEVMQSVISAANRGNISFYCLDVRGLTTESSNGTIAGLISQAATLGAGQNTVPTSPASARAQLREFDLLDEAASSHVQLNMAELAEGTGGFAVFATNNFEKNMARVVEDVRTHYEISYVPTSTVYDGHFRKLTVTVRDPKLIVQSRDGYFALPDLDGVALLPYEMEGLRALQEGQRHDFDFHAAALRFQPAPGGFRYEMAFDVDTKSLSTPVNSATHLARVHGTFLALIKSESGQIVAKVSQEVDRELPEGKLAQFQQGKIVMTLPFDAVAGRYTVDAAVTDLEGKRVSTKRVSLQVPKPGELGLSDVSVVREIQVLKTARNMENPLEFAGGKVLPAIGQTVMEGADTALYFVVYPERNAEKPKITVSFSKDGVEISRIQPAAGAADELNSIPMISAARLPAGSYVARVTVEQSGRVLREALAVTVVRK